MAPSATPQTDATERPPGLKEGWRSEIWIFVALLVFTLVARGGVLAVMWNNLSGDQDGYLELAENIMNSGVYGLNVEGQGMSPTAYRPPLYPMTLSKIAWGSTVKQATVTPATVTSATVTSATVAIFHLLLGLATVSLVYWLAQQWQLGRASPLAAALVACDPILLHQSTLPMTETLATFLAVVSLICLTRHSQRRCWWTATVAGGMMALAMLCRPVFAVMLVGSVIVIALSAPSWSRRLANVAGYLIAAMIVLAPWTARNYQLFGQPIVATTHGGFTLALGNNESFYQYLSSGDNNASWDGEGFKLELARRLIPDADLNEPQLDRRVYEETLRLIRRRPGMFAQACLYRVAQFWSPLPQVGYSQESTPRRSLRWVVGLWYALWFFCAGVGIYSLGGRLLRTPWLWGLLLCLSFTAVHTVFWSNMRMRAPLTPVVCLLAAVGAARLRESMRRRK